MHHSPGHKSGKHCKWKLCLTASTPVDRSWSRKCGLPSLASAPPLWSGTGPPWAWACEGSLSGFAIALAGPQSSRAWHRMRCGRGAQSSLALIFQASSFSSCETSSGPRGWQLARFKMSLRRRAFRLFGKLCSTRNTKNVPLFAILTFWKQANLFRTGDHKDNWHRTQTVSISDQVCPVKENTLRIQVADLSSGCVQRWGLIGVPVTCLRLGEWLQGQWMDLKAHV